MWRIDLEAEVGFAAVYIDHETALQCKQLKLKQKLVDL